MQAIALILKDLGHEVSGSDNRYDDFYSMLTSRGIKVDLSPNFDKISNSDLVIYSIAVKPTNPEFQFAKASNVKMLSRTEFLSEFQKEFANVIAVSGTHGKSTTTYLIASLMSSARLEATYHIGAGSERFTGGGKYDGKEYLVSEACEYRDSFLAFRPTIGIVLNIEKDHPDYFKDLNQIEDSFVKFAANIVDYGLLITGIKYYELFKNGLESLGRKDIRIMTIGEGGDYQAKNITVFNGKPSFDVYYKDEMLYRVNLNLYGEYNEYNALAAIAAARYYDIESNVILETLENIGGLNRRFQYAGKCNEAKIIVDYAHHPSEIKAVIETAKSITYGKLVVCFQPHTYSRTTALFEQFVHSFDNADEVIITKTYRSRETKNGKTSFDLFLELSKGKDNVSYYDDFLSIVKYLQCELKEEDTLLICGAGNVNEIANLIKNK